MFRQLLNLFQPKIINDSLLGPVEVHNDTWAGEVEIPELKDKVPFLLFFNNPEPLAEQKAIILYCRDNFTKILESCAKKIAQNTDLSDFIGQTKLDKDNLLTNFKLTQLLIAKSETTDVEWEIVFEPTSFDSGGHDFNIVYVNKDCTGFAMNG